MEAVGIKPHCVSSVRRVYARFSRQRVEPRPLNSPKKMGAPVPSRKGWKLPGAELESAPSVTEVLLAPAVLHSRAGEIFGATIRVTMYNITRLAYFSS